MMMWLCTVSNLLCHWDMKAGSERAMTAEGHTAVRARAGVWHPVTNSFSRSWGRNSCLCHFLPGTFQKKASGKQGIEPSQWKQQRLFETRGVALHTSQPPGCPTLTPDLSASVLQTNAGSNLYLTKI